MKFSIIVPIYNTEPYLERCVDTLIGQTYEDVEIILVDDESPDNSPQLCDAYAKKDERIRVIHKKNGGLSDARNAGIELATGEYILFVDSDDYIALDTCEKLLPYAQRGYEVLIGDAVVEGGTCPLSHVETPDVMTGKEYLLAAQKAGKCPMAAVLNVYRRTFLQNNRLAFKYGILHEDEEFTPRALLAAKQVVCTGVVFYHYVLRENSITTKKDKRKNAKDVYETVCELEQIYAALEEEELKIYLLDSLANNYLNMFQNGKLYQYGKEYLHKDFVKRNAKRKRTRRKAWLYCFSPRLYYFINKLSKLGR